MAKNLILLISLFYLLTLLQTSFLVHFPVFGTVLNVSLILVILANILEGPQKKSGLVLALIAGLFLDVFSGGFFGFWILISFLTAVFSKFIFRKYVRIPFVART